MIISGNEQKFLIVEDDDFTWLLLKNQLIEAGYSSLSRATDGIQALEHLSTGDFNVVLCDLNMPNMDGYEFTRLFSQCTNKPALIFMSGENSSLLRSAEELAKSYGLDIVGCLSKPIETANLRELLNSIRPAAKNHSARDATQLTPEEIRKCIANKNIVLMYQPKVCANTGDLVACEALVRLQHPENGMIGPAAFIPAAEKHGLISAITRSVLEIACKQCRTLQSLGRDIKVAVNISVSDLNMLDFPDYLLSLVTDHRICPSSIILEITESQIIDEISRPLEILTRLRMKGFGLSLDDYGTGAATMQQLKRIPFNELKIDREFVSGVSDRPNLQAMLSSSVKLGKELGLTVVAEGVETRSDLDLVRQLGVDLLQGYFFAKPMHGDLIANWKPASNAYIGASSC